MLTSSYHRSELADEHRRELLEQGARARLARAAQRHRRRARADRTHTAAVRLPVAQPVSPAAVQPVEQGPAPELAGVR
jgi:hypothetical protein